MAQEDENRYQPSFLHGGSSSISHCELISSPSAGLNPDYVGTGGLALVRCMCQLSLADFSSAVLRNRRYLVRT